MEGFLFTYNIKKRKFTRHWCVLEGQQLSQYAHFDLKKQEAVDIQGVFFVKNATIKKCEHAGKPFTLSLLCEGKKAPVFLDCGKDKNQDEWYRALSVAVIAHETIKKRTERVQESATILGIALDVELTPKLVSRSYRKLCLKAHPDKGGDVDAFNEIRAAYTKLNAYAIEEDLKANCPEIEYEAILRKVPKTGIGIIVVEDVLWGRAVIQAVQDTISIQGISEEGEGEIRPGDSLYAIEKDVCSGWPMSRIKARLNNFRVPVDSNVRLTFARRVAEDEQVSEELASPSSQAQKTDNLADTDKTHKSFENENVPESNNDKSEDNNEPQENSPMDDINDIDVDDHIPPVFEDKLDLDDHSDPDPILDNTIQEDKHNQEHDAQKDDAIQSSTTENTVDMHEENLQREDSEGTVSEDSSYVEYQRQSPVTVSENRNVVFESAFESSLRELEETKMALAECKQREKRLMTENSCLTDELSSSKAQIRVLQSEALENSKLHDKTMAELDDVKERCAALTTLLEDKVEEMKMDNFTDSSASRLQQLSQRSSDAIAYKRDINLASNNLATLKLFVQGLKKKDSRDFDSPSSSSGTEDTSPTTNHVQHMVNVSQDSDAMIASLRKKLQHCLDL